MTLGILAHVNAGKTTLTERLLHGAGVIDELCSTVAPIVVGAGPPRTVAADVVPADLDLELLVEQDGTLMGRWFVRR